MVRTGEQGLCACWLGCTNGGATPTGALWPPGRQTLPELACGSVRPQPRGVKKPRNVKNVPDPGAVVVQVTTSPASARPGLSKTTCPDASWALWTDTLDGDAASLTARMSVPRSMPPSSPCRRGQRGARAAQRARTTLTLTSGDESSATRTGLVTSSPSTSFDRHGARPTTSACHHETALPPTTCRT